MRGDGCAAHPCEIDPCAEPGELLQQLIPEENVRLRRIIRGAIGARAAKSADVDDLVQEVWLRVFSKLDSLKARDLLGVRSWLTQIARNCCHDALRRGGQATGSSRLDPEAPVLEAEGRRQDGEGHDSQTRILTRLAPDERIVLWLRGTQGLSWETVRLVMRKPSVRVARSLYARAKVRVPVLGSLY